MRHAFVRVRMYFFWLFNLPIVSHWMKIAIVFTVVRAQVFHALRPRSQLPHAESEACDDLSTTRRPIRERAPILWPGLTHDNKKKKWKEIYPSLKYLVVELSGLIRSFHLTCWLLIINPLFPDSQAESRSAQFHAPQRKSIDGRRAQPHLRHF